MNRDCMLILQQMISNNKTQNETFGVDCIRKNHTYKFDIIKLCFTMNISPENFVIQSIVSRDLLVLVLCLKKTINYQYIDANGYTLLHHCSITNIL